MSKKIFIVIMNNINYNVFIFKIYLLKVNIVNIYYCEEQFYILNYNIYDCIVLY